MAMNPVNGTVPASINFTASLRNSTVPAKPNNSLTGSPLGRKGSPSYQGSAAAALATLPEGDENPEAKKGSKGGKSGGSSGSKPRRRKGRKSNNNSGNTACTQTLSPQDLLAPMLPNFNINWPNPGVNSTVDGWQLSVSADGTKTAKKGDTTYTEDKNGNITSKKGDLTYSKINGDVTLKKGEKTVYAKSKDGDITINDTTIPNPNPCPQTSAAAPQYKGGLTYKGVLVTVGAALTAAILTV